MKIVYHCCCGMDVHRSTLKANLRRSGVKDRPDMDEIREFGTTTGELLRLSDWLKQEGCTHIAMESTGVFWKPIFNILGSDFEVILVNARHYRGIPGHKTDAKDCRWLGELLEHGLLKASFIPPQPIRELRDLTRHRRRLVEEKTSVVNRVHKVLQDANVKLSSVITNIMGKSGKAMLKKMIEGETDAEVLAQLAHGKMKEKKEQLIQALTSNVTEHHRFMLTILLKQIDFLDQLIEEFNQQIDTHIQAQGNDFFELIPLLETIPGVDRRVAQDVVAEMGINMNQFPNPDHLSSWAGLCPGNNESAGKRKSGKTTKGNQWLKGALGEIAWAASHTKATYLSELYRRIAHKNRRNSKRAIVAVAHAILVIIYHVIKNRTPYKESVNMDQEKTGNEKLARRMAHQIEKLGFKVELKKEETKKIA